MKMMMFTPNGPKILVLILILGTCSLKGFAQTWEIFDQDFNLVQKIENGNIHILGNALRINAKGEDLNLLSQEYESFATIDSASLYQYLEPWVIIKKNDKFGVFHEYGEKVLSCEYDNIQTYYNLLLAQKGNRYFIYDRGKKKVQGIGTFESARFARNGQVIGKTAQGYFLPLSDQPNHLFELLEDPCDEVILAKESSGYGLINRDGKYILDPIIESIRYIDETHFYAKNGDEYMLIKANTNNADIRYNSFHRISYDGDILLEYIHGKLRRIMKNDGILLDIVGMTAVERKGMDHYNVFFRDDKTGLLNDKGNWEVKPTAIAQELLPGDNGLYGALMEAGYGFVDREGEEIIPGQYRQVQKFSEGRCAVKKGLNWGFIDPSGKLVIPYYYERVWDFHRGLALVEKNGEFNLINQEGERMLENNYDRVSLMADNYYLTEEDGLYGLADPMGNEITFPLFNEIRREGMDHILIRKGERFGVMTEGGEYSLPIYYTEILFDNDNQRILAKNELVELPLVESLEEGKEKNRKKDKQKGA